MTRMCRLKAPRFAISICYVTRVSFTERQGAMKDLRSTIVRVKKNTSAYRREPVFGAVHRVNTVHGIR